MSHTHLPQPHHKTAESQRSDHAIITNHRQINHRSHPDHGPNRRMRAGIRSSPCTHPPPSAPTAATYLQTAEYQGSVNTPEANRQDISSTTTRARGPNRKSHHEIGTSTQPHPLPLDGQPRRHRKTAESQQSTRTITINHPRPVTRDTWLHGPNRRTKSENRSSPHRHRPSSTRQPRLHHKTAEYQGFINTPEASRQGAGHATARIHGPNRKSHHEIGTSPQPHPPTLNRRPSLPQPRNRGPPSNPSGNRTASPLYCATIHTTQVQRHSSGKAQ